MLADQLVALQGVMHMPRWAACGYPLGSGAWARLPGLPYTGPAVPVGGKSHLGVEMILSVETAQLADI